MFHFVNASLQAFVYFDDKYVQMYSLLNESLFVCLSSSVIVLTLSPSFSKWRNGSNGLIFFNIPTWLAPLAWKRTAIN